MSVFRSTVLPVFRLLLWLVIAVALVWLAFFRGAQQAPSDALVPTGQVSDPTVTATKGDIVSSVELTGTVAADAATTVRATAAGTVGRVSAPVGTAVQVGTALFTVEQTTEVAGAVTTAPDGSTSQAAPEEQVRYLTVRSTVAGVVTAVAVLVDQEVSVGADAVTVSPGTLSVSAPLNQDQQFRLLTPPATATAQAPGGPAPFACGRVRTGPPASDATANAGVQSYDPYSGQPVGPPTAQITCAVPGGTTVFAGMSVQLTLQLGKVTDVVTLPATAVVGSVGSGTVTLVDPSTGARTSRDVTLGLTDGTTVQVTDGVTEGDTVLQYAAVDPAADPAGSSTGTGG